MVLRKWESRCRHFFLKPGVFTSGFFIGFYRKVRFTARFARKLLGIALLGIVAFLEGYSMNGALLTDARRALHFAYFAVNEKLCEPCGKYEKLCAFAVKR